MEIKFSNLIKPFYYPNSPHIARYSVTCAIDAVGEGEEFLKFISGVEKNEDVESIIKNESVKEQGQHHNTGRCVVKFQGKDRIPTYVIEPDDPTPVRITLEDEFASGEKVQVIYDILRYTKKNNAQNPEYGLSFKPTKILFYPSQPSQG